MQDYILDKLEFLIAQKYIKGTFENGTEYTIVSVALNLPKEVTRLLQAFDFTKKNPKLLYINTSDELISLEDTIYLTFCICSVLMLLYLCLRVTIWKNISI